MLFHSLFCHIDYMLYASLITLLTIANVFVFKQDGITD